MLVSLSVASAINYYFHSKLNEANHFEISIKEPKMDIMGTKHEKKNEKLADMLVEPRANDKIKHEPKVAATSAKESVDVVTDVKEPAASNTIDQIVEVDEMIEDVKVVETEMDVVNEMTNADLVEGEMREERQPAIGVKSDVHENNNEKIVDSSAETGNTVLDAFYADLLNSAPSVSPKKQNVSNEDSVEPIVEDVVEAPADRFIEKKTNRSERKNKNKEMEREDTVAATVLEELGNANVSLTFEDLVVDDSEEEDAEKKERVELMKVAMPLRRVDNKDKNIKKEFDLILDFSKNW